MTALATKPVLTEQAIMMARWAALAVLLGLVDAAVPSPVPGVKPGLANLVTLWVLWFEGWRFAAGVSLLRVLASSLVLGNLFSPGFFLALSGAFGSLLVLWPASRLPRRWFGVWSWSMLAATGHMLAQMALVRVWLIPHDGLWQLAPVLLGSALLTGAVNGGIVARLLRLKVNGNGVATH